MKRVLVIAVAAMVATMGVQAKQKTKYYKTKHEVQVSIGTASNSEIVSGFGNAFEALGEAVITSIMTAGQAMAFDSYDNESYTPAIAVGYYYNVTPLIAVGGYAAYNGMNRDVIANIKTENSHKKEKVGESSRSNYSLMPSVKFHWVRKKNFGFYSKLGVGFTMMTEKCKSDEGGKSESETDTMFDFDITPFGVDGGSEYLRGFVELGMGEQGVLCAGLRYKF